MCPLPPFARTFDRCLVRPTLWPAGLDLCTQAIVHVRAVQSPRASPLSDHKLLCLDSFQTLIVSDVADHFAPALSATKDMKLAALFLAYHQVVLLSATSNTGLNFFSSLYIASDSSNPVSLPTPMGFFPRWAVPCFFQGCPPRFSVFFFTIGSSHSSLLLHPTESPLTPFTRDRSRLMPYSFFSPVAGGTFPSTVLRLLLSMTFSPRTDNLSPFPTSRICAQPRKTPLVSFLSPHLVDEMTILEVLVSLRCLRRRFVS